MPSNKERLIEVIRQWDHIWNEHPERLVDRIIAANLLAPESLVDNPVYRIVFADHDVGDHIIWIEGDPEETRRCAFESFEFHQRNWNCKLMVEIANHPDHSVKLKESL